MGRGFAGRAGVLHESVVLLEGMLIPDLSFTHVSHPLHRERMASAESHKGATLASRLTIRLLVMTEERAKGICQQPGLSQNSMSSPEPIPQRSIPRHPPAPTTSGGEIQGITLTPPKQQFGSINAAVWVAV